MDNNIPENLSAEVKVMDLIKKFDVPGPHRESSLPMRRIASICCGRRKSSVEEAATPDESSSLDASSRLLQKAEKSRRNSLSKIPILITSASGNHVKNRVSDYDIEVKRRNDARTISAIINQNLERQFKSMMVKDARFINLQHNSNVLNTKTDHKKDGGTSSLKRSTVIIKGIENEIGDRGDYDLSKSIDLGQLSHSGWANSVSCLKPTTGTQLTPRCSPLLSTGRSTSPHTISILSPDPNGSAESVGTEPIETDRRALRARTVEEVGYTIQELHHVEQQYIDTLRRGIKNYVLPFDDPRLAIPPELHGQKYHIFRNIEHIADFHEHTFFPALQECGKNVIRMCETISLFLQHNHFYPYVLYAVNNHRARRVVQKNMDYFNDRQTELKDKLGVNSFLLQPIQRLPRYQLLLLQLIKQLGKCLPDKWVRDQIALCSQAEIKMQNMLNRVNASLSLNDFEVDDDELQILHLGAFNLAFILDIYDHYSLRHFKSKLFVLDKGVVITGLMAKMELQFKQFIPLSQLAIREVTEFRLDLFNMQMPTRSLSITSDYANIAELRQRLVKHLVDDEYDTNSISKDKNTWFRTQKSRLNSDASEYDFRKDKKPKPLKHQESGTCWYHDTDSFQVGTGPTLQRLCNAEKNYFNMLDQLIILFSSAPHETRSTVLDTQTQNVYLLRRYHHELWQQIEQASGNLATIYAAFLEWIERTAVRHQLYAAHCASVFEALSLMPGFDVGSEEVNDHMYFPHSHMERLRGYLRQVRVEAADASEMPKVKVINAVESKLHESAVLVKDNLMLNLLKASIYSQFGRVTSSDSVTMDDVAHRLLVMQTGLACVKTTVNKGPQSLSLDQEFASLVFTVPFVELTMKERPKLKSLEFVLNGRDLRKVYFVSSTKRHDMKKLIKRMIKMKSRTASFQTEDCLL